MADTHEDAGSRYVSPGDVAQLFGVSVATVRNWDRDGKLIAIRTPGGHRRFLRADLDALMVTPQDAA